MLDGTHGVIEMAYRYRTRTEFGEFLDGMMKEAGVKNDPTSEEDTLAETLRKTKETNADYILQVAEGWDLDEEFSRSNIAQLCDEIPAAAMAIMSVYRNAITEGRLGN